MSPVYLNPQSSSPIPFIDLKGDNNNNNNNNNNNQQQNTFQVFGYLHGGDHLCANTSSFNSKEMISLDYTRLDQVKVEKLVLSHDKASDLGQPCSWLQSGVRDDNSYSYSINNVEENKQKNQSEKYNNDHKYSRKWKSSKVRIMQKIMTNSKNSRDSSKQQLEYDLPKRQINDEIRVCTDCHTTTTPLWRSGPQGPKSLCNACGIRQRKARRAAMAAAAAEAAATGLNNGAMITSMPRVEPPKPKIQVKKPEKGLDDDKNHTLLPLKKRSKIINANRNEINTHNNSHNNSSKKLCFEDFANKDYLNDNSMSSFPQDEEEGAILLMALSCGLACCSF